MSALPGLLPHFGELTAGTLARWVAAVRAQAGALHEHDGWLYPSDPAKLAAAEQLHAAWREWADEAEAVLARVDAAGRPGPVPGTDELRDEVGYTRAMLGLSPTEIARRRERARAGDVYTLEEVRRELRLGRRG